MDDGMREGHPLSEDETYRVDPTNGILWVVGKNRDTRRVFVADQFGGRVEIEVDDVPYLAAALSEFCFDPEEREIVQGEWS